MANKTVLERIQKIASEQLNVDTSQVTMTANFVADLGADSLDEIELVMAVEEEFQHEIPDEALQTFKTVKDVVEYIHKEVEGGEDLSA
jgi:acyl carrier protein